MGLLFDLDGQQHEVCAGPEGVWHVNLTTQVSARLQGPEDVPEAWPQNIKDALRKARFERCDRCHVCGQFEAPLCGCTHGLGEDPDWRVPAVLARTEPPPAIDPLHHYVYRATAGINMLCMMGTEEARAKMGRKIVGLVETHAARQQLISQQAERHYEAANRVLRRYARACHGTIAGLWRDRKLAYRECRQDLVDAVTGSKECVSCQAPAPLCVSVPCLHASMCAACWEQWAGAPEEAPTCPECRERVTGLHLPGNKTGLLCYHGL